MNINQQKITIQAKKAGLNKHDILWILKKASVSKENSIDIIPIVKAFRDQWTQKAIKQQKMSTDLNTYKTYEELSDAVEYTGRDFLASTGDISDFDIEKIGSVASWDIYLPKTEKGSKSFDPGQKETKWCTTRKTGNLFGQYSAAGIILFYVKSIDENDNSQMSRVSLGFNQGRVKFGGNGGLSVDKSNNGFSRSDLHKHFGVENTNEILALCDKKSKEINHIPPFTKFVQDIATHPRVFRKKMKELTIDNIYTTMVQIRQSQFTLSPLVVQEAFEKGSWETKMILFRFAYFPKKIFTINPQSTPLFVAMAFLKNQNEIVDCYLDFWKRNKNPSKLKYLSDMAVITEMLDQKVSYTSLYQYAEHDGLFDDEEIQAYQAKRIKEFLYQIPVRAIPYNEEYRDIVKNRSFMSPIAFSRRRTKGKNLYPYMFEDLYSANHNDEVLDAFVSFCTLHNLDTLESVGWFGSKDLLYAMHCIYLFRTEQSSKIRFRDEFADKTSGFMNRYAGNLPIYIAEIMLDFNMTDIWGDWGRGELNSLIYQRLVDCPKPKQMTLFKRLIRHRSAYGIFHQAILRFGTKVEIKRLIDLNDRIIAGNVYEEMLLDLYKNKHLRNNRIRLLFLLKSALPMKSKFVQIEQDEFVFTRILQSNTMDFKEMFKNQKFRGLTLQYFGTLDMTWDDAVLALLENKIPLTLQLQILKESTHDRFDYIMVKIFPSKVFFDIYRPHPKVLAHIYSHDDFKSTLNKRLFNYPINIQVFSHPILDDYIFELMGYVSNKEIDEVFKSWTAKERIEDVIKNSFVYLTKDRFCKWVLDNPSDFLSRSEQDIERTFDELLKKGTMNQKMVSHLFKLSSPTVKAKIFPFVFQKDNLIKSLEQGKTPISFRDFLTFPETAKVVVQMLEKYNPTGIRHDFLFKYGTIKSIEERIRKSEQAADQMMSSPYFYLNKGLSKEDIKKLIKIAESVHDLGIDMRTLSYLNGLGIEFDYSEL